jgi:hypothetical protein
MRSFVAAALVISIIGHPENVVCNDPRFKNGGKMMNSFVTENQYTKDISIKANTTQYKYGETVEITVTANGTKFVSGDDAPAGVYLALQVEFTGNNGQAMGQFHDMSQDLALVSNCATTAYAKTAGGAFNGKTKLLWTPTKAKYEDSYLQTTGNATFKVVWSNGVGSADPLASMLKTPNPYLFMKSVTIWDPTKWNPTTAAPTPAPAPQRACVDTTNPSGHTYKNSPVFIQHIASQNAQISHQTFATGRCLKCRFDQSGFCKSAKVICPKYPGSPVVEHTWAHSVTCDGPATRSVAVPSEFITCPGPSHHSPMELDLERFVPKLQKDFPESFSNNETAENAIAEYRRMLTLVQKYPHNAVVPSPLVDLVWHSHILDTGTYKKDTLKLFGRYLDHAPSFGGAEEKDELVKLQKEMFESYRQEFGEEAGAMWGNAQPGHKEMKMKMGLADVKGQKSPDCCSAMCVKPDCQGCVGCNAINCGFLADGISEDQRKKRVMLSPAQFGGYVPTQRPRNLPANYNQDQLDSFAPDRYKCSVTPKMRGADLAQTR